VVQGADPNGVLDFLREYVFAADQRRETAIKGLAMEIGNARSDMVIIADVVRSLRDRANLDDRDRDARRADLDATLGEITEAVGALAEALAEDRARATRVLHWLIALTATLVLALALLAALLYDRFAVVAIIVLVARLVLAASEHAV
jgi:hypothetical protein